MTLIYFIAKLYVCFSILSAFISLMLLYMYIITYLLYTYISYFKVCNYKTAGFFCFFFGFGSEQRLLKTIDGIICETRIICELIDRQQLVVVIYGSKQRVLILIINTHTYPLPPMSKCRYVVPIEIAISLKLKCKVGRHETYSTNIPYHSPLNSDLKQKN